MSETIQLTAGVEMPNPERKPIVLTQRDLEQINLHPSLVTVIRRFDDIPEEIQKFIVGIARSAPKKPIDPDGKAGRAILRMMTEYFSAEKDEILSRTPEENAQAWLENFAATSFAVPCPEVVAQIARDESIVASIKRDASKENRARIGQFHLMSAKDVMKVAKAGAKPASQKAA